MKLQCNFVVTIRGIFFTYFSHTVVTDFPVKVIFINLYNSCLAIFTDLLNCECKTSLTHNSKLTHRHTGVDSVVKLQCFWNFCFERLGDFIY